MKRPLTGSQRYAAHEKRLFGSSLQIGRKLSVLALAAVFALAACPSPEDPSPGPFITDPPVTTDTWSNVMSFSQLNGTWKGPFSHGGQNSGGPGMGVLYKFTGTGETTLTFNTSANMWTVLFTGTEVYLGEGTYSWDDFKDHIKSRSAFSSLTFNDANYSFTYEENKTWHLTDKDIAGLVGANGYFQINQDGKKIRIRMETGVVPTGLDSRFLSSEGFLTKQ